MKNETISEEIAESAEGQLLALKKAENSKIEEFKQERNRMVALKRTLSAIIYAAGDGFLNVYPQSEGFIEGRIKSLDSIEIKAKNEITEILSQIEENPDIDQSEIINKISKIDFKDLFAFSVVTTETPEHFKTGSDEKNEEFAGLSSEIKISKKRLAAHEDFTQTNRGKEIKLANDIESLRKKESSALTEEQRAEEIQKKRQELHKRAKHASSEELDQIMDELIRLAQTEVKEQIKREIGEKTEERNSAKANVEYGESNTQRTMSVYTRALRDLQYKMSEYYVENLSKFSTFKYWGTTAIRKAKRMLKLGFRAVNTGYKVLFTGIKGRRKRIQFEAQGKGYIDYKEAEFTAEGAEYHENQKTKEGIISKNIEMPDFTIIGSDLTKKIETEVRTQYSDISSIEDFGEYEMEDEIQQLREYEEKITAEIKSKGGTNFITKKEIRKKVAQAVEAAKESLIQREIERRINECIDQMADNKSFDGMLSRSEELRAIYEEEREIIQRKHPEYTQEEIEHMTRVRVLYRMKEKEISEYAESSIPMFFRANLPKKENGQILIYWFSTGESLYRFFVNRLNGLKDANGKYKYEPREQQKRALLKLTGLFEENPENFYRYDSAKDTFVGLQTPDTER